MPNHEEISNNLNELLSGLEQPDIDEIVKRLDLKTVVALEDAATFRAFGAIFGGGNIRVECDLPNQRCIVDINRAQQCRSCGKHYCKKHRLVSCPVNGCGGTLT